MKFAKEFLQDVIYAPVEEAIVGRSRWSIQYRCVFVHEGKFYQTRYSVAATENQDEQPYEYDLDEIECPEVQRVEKLVAVFEPVQP